MRVGYHAAHKKLQQQFATCWQYQTIEIQLNLIDKTTFIPTSIFAALLDFEHPTKREVRIINVKVLKSCSNIWQTTDTHIDNLSYSYCISVL